MRQVIVCAVLAVLLTTLFALQGCTANPHKIRAQLSETIAFISNEVDRRQRLGLMDSAKEIEIQKDLMRFNGYLRSDSDLPVECLYLDRVECVDYLLEEYEKYLVSK